MRRWWVALGASIGLAVGFGPIFIYSFGLFQKPILEELGLTRSQFGMIPLIATFVAAALNGYMGGWTDRKGVRPVALTGVLLLPLVLVAFSQANSLPLLLLCAAAMGLVGATTSYPTYIPLLPPWFKTRLGLAVSIAAAGVGVGAFLGPKVAAYLIGDMGWRNAMLALAVIVVAIGLPNVLVLVKDKPRDRSVKETPEEAAERKASFWTILKGSLFWRLTIAFALVPVVSIGVNFQMGALLSDRGYSLEGAAGIIGVGALAVLFARLTTGAVLDYVAPRVVGVVLFLCQATGILILLSGAGGAAPYVAVGLLGLASGGEGDLAPFVISRRFGDKAYGSVFGASFAFFNIGTAIGPFLMGLTFTRFGTYNPMLWVFVVLALIGAVLLFFAAGSAVLHPSQGEAAAKDAAAPV